jgi:hypothetical protein
MNALPNPLAQRAVRGDGALAAPVSGGDQLARRLAKRYGDRITGSFVLPGREGRFAALPGDMPPRWPRRCAPVASTRSTHIRRRHGTPPPRASMW